MKYRRLDKISLTLTRQDEDTCTPAIARHRISNSAISTSPPGPSSRTRSDTSDSMAQRMIEQLAMGKKKVSKRGIHFINSGAIEPALMAYTCVDIITTTYNIHKIFIIHSLKYKLRALKR